MKNLHIIAVLTTVVIILIVFAGCDLLQGTDPPPDPVTIAQRITRFESGLNNADRSDLYLEFHQDTAARQSVADPDFWEAGALAYAYEPYDIVIPATFPAEDADGKVTVVTTFTNDNFLPATPGSITFVMQEQEADVWFILSLDFEGTLVQTVY